MPKGKAKRAVGGDLGFDFSNAGYDVEKATELGHQRAYGNSIRVNAPNRNSLS